ncbi:hypothetical protein [Proteus columbae]|uniref:hypothetical protein n=1 Tax=Proteus columbae TaxID=1987580 RepID=UPI002889AAFF|nr:hypothetical protein [Proteus columbae]
MKQLLTGYTVNNSLNNPGLLTFMGSFLKIDATDTPIRTHHSWEVASNVNVAHIDSVKVVLDTIIHHNASQPTIAKSVASINIIGDVVVADVVNYKKGDHKVFTSLLSMNGVIISEVPYMGEEIIGCDESIRRCYNMVWAPEGYRHWTNSNGLHQITCEQALDTLNKAHVTLTGVDITKTSDVNPKIQVLTMPFELTSHENPYVMTSISKIKLWLEGSNIADTCKTMLQGITITGDVVVGHFTHKNALDPNISSCTALVYVQGNHVSISITTTNTTEAITAEAAIRGAYKLVYANTAKEGDTVNDGYTLTLANAYNLLLNDLIDQGVDEKTLPGICSNVDKGNILTVPAVDVNSQTHTSAVIGGLNYGVVAMIGAATPITKSKLTGFPFRDGVAGLTGFDQSNTEVLGVYACNSDGIKQMADDLLRHDDSKAESRSAAASLLSPTGFEPKGDVNTSAERCSMVGKSTSSKADFAAGIRSLDPSKVSFMVTQFETPKVCYEDVSGDDEDDTVVKYISRPVLLDEESGECVVVSEEDWLTGNVEANLFSVYAVCDSTEHVCVADFDTKEVADALARTLNQLHHL